jgi:HlyD family secretion protein
MSNSTSPTHSRNLAPLAFLCLALASPALAADEPKGVTVTVLKAERACFKNIVEVSGPIIAREETMVRPERMGTKVAEIMADAGDTVTSGQALARLTLPDGGTAQVQAPVGGLILSSSAVIGAVASGRGEALFTIIKGSEFDLVGLVPTQDLSKLAVDQTARIKIAGGGREVSGKVRQLAGTVEPAVQLGRVLIGISTDQNLLANSSARAMITTGQSCGISVPLTAVLYGVGGTKVQVVGGTKIETKAVKVGLMSGGNIEIREGLTEGDIVVARAGAILREGDTVHIVMLPEEETR